VLYVNRALRSQEEWKQIKIQSLSSDLRQICKKSGGLRAGLYRGFLPGFVFEILNDT